MWQNKHRQAINGSTAVDVQELEFIVLLRG
jgi:hypothetical protein